MGGRIYLIQGESQLVPMVEQEYDAEDRLQELLASYPDLLAGDQMDSTAPRRWLLVSREMGLASEEDAADRWSVDHLFLDQDGIPTLVEVKRSTDTRLRREVVGQMLDYAANAVVYWPVETIRAEFEANRGREGVGAHDTLAEFLGPEGDAEQYWQKVKTNLQAGNVRMVFVADAIPPELQRIVEFLSRQMNPAQVLAVEVKQFVGQGLKTLVPRVVGQPTKPPPPPKKGWDEKSFFEALQRRPDTDQARIARRIYDWVADRGLPMQWSKGQNGAFYVVVDHRNKEFRPVAVRTGYTNAYVEIELGSLKNAPPFQDESRRVEFLGRLNVIPNVSMPQDAINGYPSIRLSALKNQAVLEKFLEVLDWAIAEIKTS
ncbi:MAG: hypothetical protein HY691_08210 [Chloroflexi bacterium]|nr:hypothetical protein [Chloroflexota bacterium]